MAVETESSWFTATQTNREGMNSTSVDMTSTSESVGLPQSLDWFAAMVTSEELMEMGRQMIIPLKTRYGNKSGLRPQLVAIDFDKMRYSDVESSETAYTPPARQQAVEQPQIKTKVTGIPTDIDWD